MLRFPQPDALNGEQLQDELAAAGLPVTGVGITDDELVVYVEGDETEGLEPLVRKVLALHAPAPVVDPLEELRVEAAAATTVAQLRAVIIKALQ